MLDGKKQAIVIEDFEPFLEMIVQVVASFGFQVAPFNNGFDAAKHLSENRDKYDLIISDNQCDERPGFWGGELIQRAQHYKPEIKSILVSTDPVETHTADAFLLKRGAFYSELEDTIGTLFPNKAES